VKERAEMA
jgi:hypothetical protein